MATSNNSTAVSLTLLIDTKRQTVLFAEAGKDCVDFLFNLLSLPVGTVISLLSSKEGMVGCLGKLYGSVQTLRNTYTEPSFSNDSLLKPKHSTAATVAAAADALKTLTFHEPPSTSSDKSLYYCNNCRINFGKAEAYGGGGYVKGVVTYMIMDDLEVMPMSTISSITMLNKLNVKDVGALEEKVVHLGMPEGVKLLRESLQSKLVLTNVFLKGNQCNNNISSFF